MFFQRNAPIIKEKPTCFFCKNYYLLRLIIARVRYSFFLKDNKNIFKILLLTKLLGTNTDFWTYTPARGLQTETFWQKDVMYRFWHTYTMKAKWANKAGEISHMSFLLLWVLSTTLLLNIYVRVCLRLSTKPFVIIWAKRGFPILKYLLAVCANICRIYFVWFMYMKKLIFYFFVVAILLIDDIWRKD